jgi:glutamyl-tRNA reductase
MVVLSTCNRIELYAYVDAAPAEAHTLLLNYLDAHHPIEVNTFRDYLYFYTGDETVEQLLRVAAGLDSLVLGEPQILGQVTSAFMQAVETGSAGPALTALFHGAIRAGKRARSETAISSNPATVSSVAIALAEDVVGDLRGQRVLVVGLGDMGQMTLNALRKRGVEQISLVNRSRERAEEIAAAWHGNVYDLAALPQALAGTDVVISATAAPYPIIDTRAVERAMVSRQGQPLVLIDIAVPRDVDPAVRVIPGIHLYNMDDLQTTLDEALAARQEEIPRVEAILAEEATRIADQFRMLTVAPVIATLRQKAEAIRQRELQRTLRYLGDDVDPETVKHVQHLSRSLVNKLLHEPTVRLRQQAGNGDDNVYVDAVRELFNLNSEG